MKTVKVICYCLGYGLVAVCLLLIVLYLPEKYVKNRERYAMEQVNRKLLEMETYKLTFHNFAEKLSAIGRVYWQGGNTQLIQMPDYKSEAEAEELTGYVKKEAKLLLEDMWETKIPINTKELEKQEFYMLYGSQEGEEGNTLPGVYLYRLVYVTEWLGYDNVELEFYLDAEFHKLYRFSVTTLYSNVNPYVDGGLLEKIQNLLKSEIEDVLSVDTLSKYWELEDSYNIKTVYGDDFIWNEKKNWGIGAQDKILMEEKGTDNYYDSGFDIWKYVLFDEMSGGFHMQMGIYMEADAEDENRQVITDG